SGLYLSTDNGSDWTKTADQGLDMPFQTGIGAFAQIDSTLFVTSSKVIDSTSSTITTAIIVSRSTNNGASWTEANEGIPYDVSPSAFAVIGSTIVTTANDNGIFRSTDLGTTWTPANNGLATYSLIRAITAIGNDLFVSVSGPSSDSTGIFLSTDNAMSWNVVNSGLPQNRFISQFVATGSNLFALDVDSGIYLSTNLGANWHSVNTGLSNNPVVALATSDQYLFAGTGNNGIWRRPLSDFGINDVKDQIQNDLNISLFPNPVSGILSIHNAPENLISVSIVNVLGEQMIEMASPKTADFVIDLSKVLPGAYFARFTMSDKIINIKLLKL
ncbi:MAG: T9SS type A sorting domain-containing protein, partial [Candidatus Kapaibacterium sp.]